VRVVRCVGGVADNVRVRAHDEAAGAAGGDDGAYGAEAHEDVRMNESLMKVFVPTVTAALLREPVHKWAVRPLYLLWLARQV